MNADASLNCTFFRILALLSSKKTGKAEKFKLFARKQIYLIYKARPKHLHIEPENIYIYILNCDLATELKIHKTITYTLYISLFLIDVFSAE